MTCMKTPKPAMKILQIQKYLFLNKRAKSADSNLLISFPSHQIDIIAFQTFFTLGHGDDIAVFFREGERELRHVDPGKDVRHRVREDAVFDLHPVQHADKRLHIGYLNADASAACSVQFSCADLFYHMSGVVKAVVSGKSGELIQKMAGDEEGDPLFTVQLQDQFPDLDDPL